MLVRKLIPGALLLGLLGGLVVPLPAQTPNVVVPPSPPVDGGATMRLTPIPDTIAPLPHLVPRLPEGIPDLSPLRTFGSVAEDRDRVAQILGLASTEGFLIRSPSSQIAPIAQGSAPLRWTLLLPELRSVINTDIPFSRNEDGMWGGRGLNTQLTTGVHAEYGRASLLLAPHFRFQANSRFRLPGTPAPDRHPFSSLWHTGRDGAESADLPRRFGEGPIATADRGQSALWVDLGRVALGAATESQWWGPGIRNAIVMSNNAPGIPHLFLRSTAPLRTRFGSFETKWMVGALSESAFFDTIPENDTRSLSALAATFQPTGEPNLTLGLARSVYAPVRSVGAAPLRLFDVLTRSGRYADQEGPDQVVSLFGRWVLPEDGVEVYAEWARAELPLSLRDLLRDPNHTQGYTLGLQWAGAVRGSALVRIQAELTQLEQSPTYRHRPATSFYSSQQVPQGYTQRGQIIGAAIGPGGSSQWIAADYLESEWGVGLFGGRIRWENDAYYRHALDGRLYTAHDVSVLGGVRAQYRFPALEVGAEVIRQQRLNYLFQNWSFNLDALLAVDQPNTTVRLLVTPRHRSR
ncbi:MAG: capsule assembly Wzi family protein [Longimicrobiaceae bacterium]